MLLASLSIGSPMRFARIAVISVCLGLLAGCNTIDGAGKDLSSAGKAISKTAKDVAN
jgi:predicted small secreted protein